MYYCSRPSEKREENTRTVHYTYTVFLTFQQLLFLFAVCGGLQIVDKTSDGDGPRE
jgi:hypothetical protein